jgi:hypothetical protein
VGFVSCLWASSFLVCLLVNVIGTRCVGPIIRILGRDDEWRRRRLPPSGKGSLDYFLYQPVDAPLPVPPPPFVAAQDSNSWADAGMWLASCPMTGASMGWYRMAPSSPFPYLPGRRPAAGVCGRHGPSARRDGNDEDGGGGRVPKHRLLVACLRHHPLGYLCGTILEHGVQADVMAHAG